MESCPRCGKLSVAYDTYHKQKRCFTVDCVYSEGTLPSWEQRMRTLEQKVEKLEMNLALMMNESVKRDAE